VHADRGAPMTSTLVAELLLDRGVPRRHSRSSVSNDNPNSEAQFRTMKYGPSDPERFGALEEAQAWISSFIDWYNTAQRHSRLRLQPPVVHKGQAAAVSAARRQTLERGLCPPPRTLCGRTTHATAGASGGMDQPATPAAANGDYGHGDRGSGAGSVVGQAWPLSASAVTTGFVFFKLQLVMFFEGIRSERQLEYVGSDRLRVSWSLGYGLHAPLPDHASLTRIQHHKPLV